VLTPEIERVGSFRFARDGRTLGVYVVGQSIEGAFRMRIANVLRAKGLVVPTVTPDTSVADVLAVLTDHSVGAVVVVHDGAVVGMVWERDIIRHLHQRGASILEAPVSEVMNVAVISCVLTDEVDGILRTMTDHRIRYLPVMVGNELSGIVSMGDLVKARIGELETDRSHLVSYIATQSVMSFLR